MTAPVLYRPVRKMDTSMVLMSLFSLLLTLHSTETEAACLLDGTSHEVGETWHPAAFGTCVNCTCQINAQGEEEVHCINTADKCPRVTCVEPKRGPQSCCPYCEVRSDEDKSSSSAEASCTTEDGKVYKDGERYSSNSTGLRPTSDNQCVMCVCQNGHALCYLKTCHVTSTCTSFVESTGDCCPVCADLSEMSWEDPGYFETKAVIDAIKEDNDCLDSNGIKKNGSTWHPNIDWIESAGQIDCITCQCINGEIKCQKDCIPDDQLPCKKPRKRKGQCCNTCPDRRKRRRKGRKGRKDRKDKKDRDNKKKATKRRCKGNNKDKKRCRTNRESRKSALKARATTAVTAPPTATPGIHLQNLCLRKKSKYLVYKAIGSNEMFIGFDDLGASNVYLFRWSIDKVNGRQVVSFIGEDTVSAPDFRRTINNTNVIGTTGKKHYKRFKRRLKDKVEKCASGCEPELFIKIIQRVKVRLLKFGQSCKS